MRTNMAAKDEFKKLKGIGVAESVRYEFDRLKDNVTQAERKLGEKPISDKSTGAIVADALTALGKGAGGLRKQYNKMKSAEASDKAKNRVNEQLLELRKKSGIDKLEHLESEEVTGIVSNLETELKRIDPLGYKSTLAPFIRHFNNIITREKADAFNTQRKTDLSDYKQQLNLLKNKIVNNPEGNHASDISQLTAFVSSKFKDENEIKAIENEVIGASTEAQVTGYIIKGNTPAALQLLQSEGAGYMDSNKYKSLLAASEREQEQGVVVRPLLNSIDNIAQTGNINSILPDAASTGDSTILDTVSDFTAAYKANVIKKGQMIPHDKLEKILVKLDPSNKDHYRVMKKIRTVSKKLRKAVMFDPVAYKRGAVGAEGSDNPLINKQELGRVTTHSEAMMLGSYMLDNMGSFVKLNSVRASVAEKYGELGDVVIEESIQTLNKAKKFADPISQARVSTLQVVLSGEYDKAINIPETLDAINKGHLKPLTKYEPEIIRRYHLSMPHYDELLQVLQIQATAHVAKMELPEGFFAGSGAKDQMRAKKIEYNKKMKALSEGVHELFESEGWFGMYTNNLRENDTPLTLSKRYISRFANGEENLKAFIELIGKPEQLMKEESLSEETKKLLASDEGRVVAVREGTAEQLFYMTEQGIKYPLKHKGGDHLIIQHGKILNMNKDWFKRK